MKHLFVPYNIARQLKEKGFNEPCFTYWFTYCYTIDRRGPKLKESGFKDLNGWVNFIGSEVAAPLYSQVIDWFRQKHDIDIFINAHYKTDNSIAGYMFDIYDRKQKYGTHKGCFESPDYYEALTKVIEAALNLI